MKKRKLTRGVGGAAPEVEKKGVASFLAARKRPMPKPSMPCMANVEVFLANEPVVASQIATEPLLEEPLQVPKGLIPTASILYLLISNIQHILEDLEFESEDLVGMKGDNIGHQVADGEEAQPKPLSPIPEVGTSS